MIKQSKLNLALLIVALVVAGVSLGCNTYRGLGKDVSNTGDAMQKNK